jgi:hypothetical protein
MSKMKRAQTAIEYLMTYGFAVLIIIVISAALYALGVFNPGAWLPGGPRASGFGNIKVIEFAVNSTSGGENGTLKVVLVNAYGYRVRLDLVGATMAGVSNTTGCAPGVNIAPGQQYTCYLWWELNFPYSPGDTYTAAVSIYFVDQETPGTPSLTDTGTLTGPVGTGVI